VQRERRIEFGEDAIMKLKKTAAGLLIFGLGSATFAGPPPLDRPSPPPCAADGRCYPNPLTYGWYETRWRRWPLECIEQGPPGQTTPQPLEGIDTTEKPGKTTEDQKAPPPTEPREEPIRTPVPNTGPSGQGGTQQPGVITPVPLPAGPLLQPGETPPASPYRNLPPYNPGGPSGKSGLKESTSIDESDPPPALPFGPRSVMPAAPVREASRPPALPIRRPARAASNAPNDDPPPSLPGTLASLSN
jgi:hypothetical protein